METISAFLLGYFTSEFFKFLIKQPILYWILKIGFLIIFILYIYYDINLGDYVKESVQDIFTFGLIYNNIDKFNKIND